MTWCVPPFDQAIELLLAHVRAEYAPRGIVVSGSIVRGEAGPTSDLDVLVVHDAAWRLRDQRRFAGVPAELFVNPPAQTRRYFASEHEAGRPSTAHMFATGEPIAPVDPVVAALIDEARDWLARPLEISPARLEARRYAPVDLLDDARDVAAGDPATARLLLGEAVRLIVEYAFWRARRFQPRRKRALAALEDLARHVLGVDAFFAWSSGREPVAL
ncbi:MAG TPA: nucleotidyltransferase domain-containing protein [Kofleriaceae bacterium]|nr:nucleotidyltransferase domain-containing protein [Kofleriaceae bacterium]